MNKDIAGLTAGLAAIIVMAAEKTYMELPVNIAGVAVKNNSLVTQWQGLGLAIFLELW